MTLHNISIPFGDARRNARRTAIAVKKADPSVSDAELVRSFLGGDDGGFAMLLDRHIGGVHSFVYRFLGDADDASDVTQEVFIRVWKNMEKFDLEKNFRTWILAIAKNAALDFIKKKKPVLFSALSDGEGDVDAFLAPYVAGAELPNETLEREDMKRDLESALGKLPPAYRLVLALRYSEYLKFREIAEVLGEPIDTVKSKHRRGLMLLRKAFPGPEVR